MRSSSRAFNTSLTFSTKGEIDFIDVSETVRRKVAESRIRNGIVHVFCPHATGILILTENDPDLLEDIRVLLGKLVPARDTYRHPANAYSHLRSMLLPPDKTLPVIDGRVMFGTWQSLVFVETDTRPRKRTLIVSVLGN
jgi:secondary thiamine-phosphate synthase enzyme